MASADFFSRLPRSNSSDLDKDSENFFDVDETIFALSTLSKDDAIFSYENRSFTAKEMAAAQNACSITKNLVNKAKINKWLMLKDGVLD